MTPDAPNSSVFWKPDSRIDEVRRRPGWKEFHRVCGSRNLFFDDLDRAGKTGTRYRCIALALEGFPGGGSMGAETRHQRVKLSDGQGADPLAAIVDAFEKSGRADDPDMRAACDRLLAGKRAVAVPPLEDLLG